MISHILKAAAAGTIVLGVGVAAVQGIEKQREIDVDRCERIPANCPNRTITLVPAADTATAPKEDRIGKLILQLN